jgi:hypothetical protein
MHFSSLSLPQWLQWCSQKTSHRKEQSDVTEDLWDLGFEGSRLKEESDESSLLGAF